MAAELNRVFLLGNLTQDPELRHLDSGTAVATLRLASNRTYRTRDGEQRDEVCFVNVETWDRLAENCSQYLRKGSQVLVEGRLTYRTWETDSGDRRSIHEIRANTVQFLSRPEGAGGGGYDAPTAGGGRQQEQADDIDDDIPF